MINIRLFITLLFAILILDSCKDSELKYPRLSQGVITYSIMYDDSSSNSTSSGILPDEVNCVFKDSASCYIVSAGYGVIQIVRFLNKSSLSYPSLLIDNLGVNIAYKEDDFETIRQNENNPLYSFEISNETKTIASIECKKAIVNDKTNHLTFDIYFDEKTMVFNQNSPYKDFNYLLMEYPYTSNGFTMKLKAKKTDFNPIDTSLLSLKGDFIWVSKAEFFNKLESLKLRLKK